MIPELHIQDYGQTGLARKFLHFRSRTNDRCIFYQLEINWWDITPFQDERGILSLPLISLLIETIETRGPPTRIRTSAGYISRDDWYGEYKPVLVCTFNFEIQSLEKQYTELVNFLKFALQSGYTIREEPPPSCDE